MASETTLSLDISIEILITCIALKKVHPRALIDNALMFHDLFLKDLLL